MDLTALLLSRIRFAFTVSFFAFPLMLAYAAVNYSVSRGKVRPTRQHY